MGTRENKFQSSGHFCKHRQNSIISFILPVLSSISYEGQHSFSTFGVARNDFFFFKKIFKTVAQKFAMQCKIIILVLGFCPFVTGISGGFCLTAQR